MVASRDADGGRAQKSKREGAYFFLVAFFFVAFFTVFFGAVFTAFFFVAFFTVFFGAVFLYISTGSTRITRTYAVATLNKPETYENFSGTRIIKRNP